MASVPTSAPETTGMVGCGWLSTGWLSTGWLTGGLAGTVTGSLDSGLKGTGMDMHTGMLIGRVGTSCGGEIGGRSSTGLLFDPPNL